MGFLWARLFMALVSALVVSFRAFIDVSVSSFSSSLCKLSDFSVRSCFLFS